MELAHVPSTAHESAPHGALDPLLLRRCLGQFATGVTVVTYAVDGEPRGATVNSFTSVCMSPPLVLVAINRQARAASSLRSAPFTINVLAAEQLGLAQHFAGRPQPGMAVPWAQSSGTPRLQGCMAWIECATWQTHGTGDHILFVGRVVAYEQREAEALLFHAGQFRSIGLVL